MSRRLALKMLLTLFLVTVLLVAGKPTVEFVYRAF